MLDSPFEHIHKPQRYLKMIRKKVSILNFFAALFNEDPALYILFILISAQGNRVEKLQVAQIFFQMLKILFLYLNFQHTFWVALSPE